MCLHRIKSADGDLIWVFVQLVSGAGLSFNVACCGYLGVGRKWESLYLSSNCMCFSV